MPIQQRFFSRLAEWPLVPDVIYHYTSAEGLLGILQTNRLWASDVLYMNDSTEVEYGRKFIIEEGARAATVAKSAMAKTLFSSIEHVLYPMGIPGSGFYAACFCQTGDLLSQWRGYSGGRGGYSLGFRVRDLQRGFPETIPERRFFLRRVTYAREEQKELIAQVLADVDNVLHELASETTVAMAESGTGDREQAVHSLISEAIQGLMLELMLTMKNDVFKEEQEWRLIHHRIGFGREPEATLHYRATPSFIVPYVKLDLTPMGPEVLARVRPEHAVLVKAGNGVPVSKVIVGPTAHPPEAKASVQSLLREMHISASVDNSRIPLRA